jgi:hypothetical protein
MKRIEQKGCERPCVLAQVENAGVEKPHNDDGEIHLDRRRGR